MAHLVAQVLLKISGLGQQWETTGHKMSCLELCARTLQCLREPSRAVHALVVGAGAGRGGDACQEPRFLGFGIMTDLMALYFSIKGNLDTVLSKYHRQILPS